MADENCQNTLSACVNEKNFHGHRHYSTTVNPDMKMDFGEFLDLITKDEPSTIRMFRYNLYKQNPILRKDFSCPSFIKRLNPMRRFGFMFLGGKDTDVRLHCDVDYSNVLLTQFYGRKKVILFCDSCVKLICTGIRIILLPKIFSNNLRSTLTWTFSSDPP